MEIVERRIQALQAKVAAHPFFTSLRPDPSIERALAFAPPLAFWVLGFQDIVRLNQERIQDPELRALMARHRADDVHDQWFLEDLSRIGGEEARTLSWLYRPARAAIRDGTYAVASEVFRISDDRLRVVLVMVLEAAGRVFFDKVAAHVEASGHTAELRYFSRVHLDAELDHDLFEEENQRRLLAIELPPAVRAEAISMVDRLLAALLSIADALAH